MTTHQTIRHYEVRRELGRGSYGVVYEAFDTRLLRPVVLKMLHGRGASAVERAGLLEEARLASAIDHPNVCAIYEADVDAEERPFIVMQYVPGRPLSALIDEGPLNLPLAVSSAIQIADGLAAAHALDIVHRDLKPSNVMITDHGVIKILDFGLAKRRPGVASGDLAPADERSTPLGTVGYMAPEQFVGGRSSAQSDIYGLGVILYKAISGRHPFEAWSTREEITRAIQYVGPRPLRELRPEVPAELESIVTRALAKNPANRWTTAGDLRDALRTTLLALEVDPGLLPGRNVSPAASSGRLKAGKAGKAGKGTKGGAAAAAGEQRRRGVLSMFVERFLGGDEAPAPPPGSVAVLPFKGSGDAAPLYGLALAEAIAGRLARLPGVLVRPTTSAFALAQGQGPLDLAEAGSRLVVANLLEGSYVKTGEGFALTWQLVEAATGRVRTGGSLQVPTLDLVAVQNEVAAEVFTSLRGAAELEPRDPGPVASLDGDASERYLEARALLTRFSHRTRRLADLERAEAALEEVVAQAPRFAPAVSALGLASLHRVRNGFGGPERLARAHELFARAIELDPGLREPKLFRVFTFLAQGEKDSARGAVGHLLEAAPDDFDVNVVAAVLLRLDGLYGEALERLGAALRLDPSAAHVVYDQRSRLLHYEGQLDLALREVEKGLALAPVHPLLRTGLGYLQLRRGDLEAAVATLEGVLRDEPGLHIVAPTLAMAYVRAGRPDDAAALIGDATLRAAASDGETAYRVATYYAVTGERDEALSWLRKAVYLGNESYPWFAANPAWEDLRDDPDLRDLLAELRERHEEARRRWRHLLGS